MGCQYDWGTGLCLDREVEKRTTGCANYFEGVMNDKIFPQGVVLYGTIVLESFTILTACSFCWKRKENDVLATTYIYDEPWDPVKEGKLQLHPIEDAAAMGDGED